MSDKEAAANALADCKKNDKAGSQGPRNEDEGDGQAATGGKVSNTSDDGDKCKCGGRQRCGAAGGGGGEVVVHAKKLQKCRGGVEVVVHDGGEATEGHSRGWLTSDALNFSIL